MWIVQLGSAEADFLHGVAFSDGGGGGSGGGGSSSSSSSGGGGGGPGGFAAVYAGGYTAGTLEGARAAPSAGRFEAWVGKFDAATGATLWLVQRSPDAAGVASEYLYALAVRPDTGGVVLGGSSTQSAAATTAAEGAALGHNLWLAEVSGATGAVLWTERK